MNSWNVVYLAANFRTPTPVDITHLQLYRQPKAEQVKNLKSAAEDVFVFLKTGDYEIHNYYLCLEHYCEDICAIDKEKMNSNNKNVSA